MGISVWVDGDSGHVRESFGVVSSVEVTDNLVSAVWALRFVVKVNSNFVISLVGRDGSSKSGEGEEFHLCVYSIYL